MLTTTLMLVNDTLHGLVLCHEQLAQQHVEGLAAQFFPVRHAVVLVMKEHVRKHGITRYHDKDTDRPIRGIVACWNARYDAAQHAVHGGRTTGGNPFGAAFSLHR